MAMANIFINMIRTGSPYHEHHKCLFVKLYSFFELIQSASHLSKTAALKIFSMKCVANAKNTVAVHSKAKFTSQLASIMFCVHVDQRQIYSNDKESIKNMVSLLAKFDIEI